MNRKLPFTYFIFNDIVYTWWIFLINFLFETNATVIKIYYQLCRTFIFDTEEKRIRDILLESTVGSLLRPRTLYRRPSNCSFVLLFAWYLKLPLQKVWRNLWTTPSVMRIRMYVHLSYVQTISCEKRHLGHWFSKVERNDSKYKT